MNFSKLTGLNNLGNTCYLNSGLQLLFKCKLLNQLLLNNEINNNFLNGYKKTIEDYYREDVNILGPRIIINSLCSEYNQFTNFIQADSSEFLVCIFELLEKNFNLLENKLYTKCNNSNLLEFLFDCKIKSNIKCSITNEIFERNENDKILSLPIPNKENITFMDCLNEYFKEEELIDDNQYYNEKINRKVNATKKLVITNYPKYMFFSFKRFTNLVNKLDNDISIDNTYNFDNNEYYLIGFIVHIGSVGGGHYISCIKENEEWYICNDRNISKCDNIDKYLKQSYILLFSR